MRRRRKKKIVFVWDLMFKGESKFHKQGEKKYFKLQIERARFTAFEKKSLNQ